MPGAPPQSDCRVHEPEQIRQAKRRKRVRLSRFAAAAIGVTGRFGPYLAQCEPVLVSFEPLPVKST